MKIRSLLFYLLVSFIIVSCSDSDFAFVSSAKYNTDLRVILEKAYNSSSVPGTALLVRFKDGSIWKKAAGFATLGSNVMW